MICHMVGLIVAIGEEPFPSGLGKERGIESLTSKLNLDGFNANAVTESMRNGFRLHRA